MRSVTAWELILRPPEALDQNPRSSPTTLPRIFTARRVGSMTIGAIVGFSGLSTTRAAVAQEPLHRRLRIAARLRLDHRGDDVVRLSRVLAPHEHEIAVADVGVDHRVAANAQRKDVLAAPGQRRRRDGHLALAVLLRQERRARGDAAEDRHLTVGSPSAGVGKGERS